MIKEWQLNIMSLLQLKNGNFLNLKNNKSKFFLDSAIVNSASLIEKFFFFIATIIVARYLSIEHFGEFSTALSYATFFSAITDIGINISLIRAINLENKYENEHFTNAFCLKVTLAVIVYLFMAFSLYCTGYNYDVIKLILILGLVRIGNEFMTTYYAADEAKRNFIFPAIINSIYVVIFFISVVFVIVLHGNYYHISIARLIVVYLFVFLLSIRTFKKFTIIFNKNIFVKFVKSVIPFSLISIFWNFTFKINPLIISFISGTTYVGLFNNALMFIDTISLIPDNLRKVIMPTLYKTLEENDMGKFQFIFDTMSKYLGITSFYIMIIFYLFAKNIIYLIFGSKYKEAIPVLQILSFALPMVFNVASITIVGMDKQKILLRILMISTMINIISNITLISLFGVIGSAMSVVITYGVIYYSGHLYLYKKENIKIKLILLTYGKLILITIILISSYNLYFKYVFNELISALIITILYIMLILIMLFSKDDIRIIKEMLQIT